MYDPRGKRTDVYKYVDDAIKAIPTPDVSVQIKAHNESKTAHPYILGLIPTKISQLNNDSGYLTQHQDISGKQDKITANGVLKGDGKGNISAAKAETDFASPVTLRKVTLTVAGWNSSTKQQSVAVSGILADGTKQRVFCSAVDESYESAWSTCFVQCVGHAANSLTFQCEEIPTVAVEVFVSIQPVSFAS